MYGPKVTIEIGPNLAEAIKALLEAVDKENARSLESFSPGQAIQLAFRLDLTKVAIKEIESLTRRRS